MHDNCYDLFAYIIVEKCPSQVVRQFRCLTVSSSYVYVVGVNQKLEMAGIMEFIILLAVM